MTNVREHNEWFSQMDSRESFRLTIKINNKTFTKKACGDCNNQRPRSLAKIFFFSTINLMLGKIVIFPTEKSHKKNSQFKSLQNNYYHVLVNYCL